MKVIPETHRVHYIRCLRFNHSPVLSSFITCSWVCNKSNTTGVTSGTGTDYPFAAPELTLLALVGFVLLYLIFLYSVLQIIICRFVFFTFDHCIVCTANYGFLLPLNYHRFAYLLGIFDIFRCSCISCGYWTWTDFGPFLVDIGHVQMFEYFLRILIIDRYWCICCGY